MTNTFTITQEDMTHSEETAMFAINAIDQVEDSEVDRWAAQAFNMIRIHAVREERAE